MGIFSSWNSWFSTNSAVNDLLFSEPVSEQVIHKGEAATSWCDPDDTIAWAAIVGIVGENEINKSLFKDSVMDDNRNLRKLRRKQYAMCESLDDVEKVSSVSDAYFVEKLLYPDSVIRRILEKESSSRYWNFLKKKNLSKESLNEVEDLYIKDRNRQGVLLPSVGDEGVTYRNYEKYIVLPDEHRDPEIHITVTGGKYYSDATRFNWRIRSLKKDKASEKTGNIFSDYDDIGYGNVYYDHLDEMILLLNNQGDIIDGFTVLDMINGYLLGKYSGIFSFKYGIGTNKILSRESVQKAIHKEAIPINPEERARIFVIDENPKEEEEKRFIPSFMHKKEKHVIAISLKTKEKRFSDVEERITDEENKVLLEKCMQYSTMLEQFNSDSITHIDNVPLSEKIYQNISTQKANTLSKQPDEPKRINTKKSLLSSCNQWQHIREEHSQALAIISSYENDPWLAISYPAFNDVRVPQVSTMMKKLKRLQRVIFSCQIDLKKVDVLIDRNKNSKLPNNQIYNEYSEAVDDLVMAVKVAEKTARAIAYSDMSDKETQLLQQAKGLLVHAEDPANTAVMRENYYAKLKSIINDLNQDHEIVPVKVAAEIESISRLELEHFKDYKMQTEKV